MRYAFIIHLSFFVSSNVFAGSYKVLQIDTAKIYKELKSTGNPSLISSFHTNFFKSIEFENDTTLFYNPNGSLHLFKIQLSKDPTISKLSSGHYHGHNFKRHLFIFNHLVYSFGGEGLFNANPNLIVFDTNSLEWVKKEINNYPYDARAIVSSWIKGDTLRCVINHLSEVDGHQKHTKYTYGYILLSDFEYHQDIEFYSSNDADFVISDPDFYFQSTRYDLFGYKENQEHFSFAILDKNTTDLFMFRPPCSACLIDSFSFTYIEESKLFTVNTAGAVDSVDISSINRFGNRNIAQITTSKSSSYVNFIGLFAILFFCSILTLIFYRKANKKATSPNELNQLEMELLKMTNDVLTKDTLDEIFEIGHYSLETTKQKRSFFINEINSRGKLKITRQRRVDDQRSYDYLISSIK